MDAPKPAQDQSSQLYNMDGREAYEVSPLAEDILAIDGCCYGEGQFLLRAWPIIAFSMES